MTNEFPSRRAAREAAAERAPDAATPVEDPLDILLGDQAQEEPIVDASAGPASAAPKKSRPKTTFTGVVAELLITVGVVVMLYVSWQMWIGDWIQRWEANQAGASLSEEWAEQAKHKDLQLSDPDSPYNTLTASPPVMSPAEVGKDYAQLRVPRWGANYNFTMAGGIKSWESLNHTRIGVYPDQATPGQPGNFAIAGHRGSYGAPFEKVPALHVGDAIVIETADGWYTYRFRNLEYIQPTQVDVLAETPQQPQVGITGQYITLTTCAPRFGWSERIAAWGTFEAFTPRSSDGKEPASLFLSEGS